MKNVVVGALLLAWGGLAYGQSSSSQFNWEEASRRLEASQKVSPLGSNLLGEQVSLSNGALSFHAVDLDIPGNNSLPVTFSRSYSVFNRKGYASDGMLGDWQVDIPSISGVFAPNWIVGTSGSSQRCTSSELPVPPQKFTVGDFWQGIQLDLPGGGELLRVTAQTTVPTAGGPYVWVTGDGRTVASCLSSLKNKSGSEEGFLVTTADGTRYWFDWMAQTLEPESVNREYTPDFMVSSLSHVYTLTRKKNYLYATRVEDRFGNYVTYTYSNAWNEPGKLTAISSSDGRNLTVSYTSGRVSSVSDGARTWSYAYAGTTSGRATLTNVTLPNGRGWAIGFSQFTNAEIKFNEAPLGEPLRDCEFNEVPLNYDSTPTGTITHPSGGSGVFVVNLQEHGRSKVPLSCGHVTTYPTGAAPGTGNNTNDDINIWPISAYSYTLLSKRLTGPGLPTLDWSYSYIPNISVYRYPGTTQQYPVCNWGSYNCALPPCTSESCAGASTTTVTEPNGSWTRYRYGNTYLYNEGKLLSVERGASGQSAMRVDTSTYDLSLTDATYPAAFGASLRANGDGFQSQYHRPLLTQATSLQQATFSLVNQAFDAFASPTSVKRESSLGLQVTDAFTYENNLSKWVLGQVSTQTCMSSVPAFAACDGGTDSVVSEVVYSSYAQPLWIYSFGKLVQRLTHDVTTPGQMGVVSSVKDGNNQTTTLSSWYRGVPRLITYPDGKTQSAVVDANGWVTSVTDENGYATGYGYDSMGRLSSITYPANDAVAWSPTTLTFEPVASSEYGLGAGHWRQTVATGNARKVSYFDALWRPIVVREYDAANIPGTQRFTRFAYDHEGRTVFASYPGTTDALTTGLWTEYDALGRPTSVSQDSELGLLTTTTQYLPGFLTQTTNPRGESTITGYMAFDQPSTDWPVSISHPEGAYTDIVRDVYGKPTAITRGDSGGSVAVTRSYAYNGNQELCRSTEPETGATLMGYDGAGNLAWSAAGVVAGTACDLEGDTAAILPRRVTRGYDPRNRVTALNFPDGKGDTTYTYFDDGKLASMSVDNSGSATDIVVTTYGYNKRRLPTSERMQYSGIDWSIGYGYDVLGNLASQSSPGLSVTYAPNALGQPTQAGSYATGVSYYPNGGIKQFTYGNGIVHTMTQNARQLPARSTDTGGSNPLDLAYGYDGNSNVTAITDYATGRQTRTMTYDGLDRLLTAQSVMFGGTDNVARYTYDVLDNLKTLKVGTRNYGYVYDATNRLTNITNGVGGASLIGLSYDEQGNLEHKNGQAYDFDYGNRLRAVPGKGSYVYDGAGRRVKDSTSADKYSLYSQSGQLAYENDLRQAKTTGYVYLGGSLVARVNNSTAPSTPSLSVPGTSSTGSYTVSWSTAVGANSYELQEQVNGGSWTQVYSGSATSHAFSGKAAGDYGYRIRACLNAGCSSWSGGSTVAVTLPPGSTPTLTAPSQGLNGSYSLSWTTVSAATSYEVEESFNSGGWTTAYSGGATSQAFTGKAAGSYAYRVKACNAGGCSGVSASQTVSVIYPPGTASAPTVPATSNTGSYTASWSAVSGATSYTLEEGVNGGAYTAVYSGGATSQGFTGKGSGTYSYRVKACNAAGCGAVSGTDAVVVTLPPGETLTLTAPASSYTGDYTLSWTSVTTATSYTLEESFNSGSWTTAYSGSATSQAFSGKAAGSYAYRVKACNAGGCSGVSASKTVSVIYPPGTASAPTVPATSNTGSYTASWSAVSGATSYTLEESVNGGAYTGVYSGSATSQAFTGKGSGTYSYRVMACNAAGCGAVSGTDVVVVTLPPASAPALTAPSQGLGGSYSLSWTTVSAATSYTLEESFNSGSWTTAYSGSATSEAFTGKAAGSYAYRVKACNAGGCSAVSASKTVSVIYPPGTASAPTVPATSNTGSYTASWSAVSGATSYTLEESVNGGAYTGVYSGGATSQAFTGKGSGTYSYRVMACNAAGCGAASGTDAVVVTLPPTATPTTTAPASSSTGSYTVSWTSVATATSYELEESSNGGSSWSNVYSGSATSKALASKPSGTYSYRSRGCNAGGCGPYSATKSTVVTLPPTAAPTVTAPATTSSTSGYTVSWTTAATATSYQLEESSNGGSSWTQVYSGSATSKAIAAKPAGNYSYRARGCNAGGCGPYSATKTTASQDPVPAAPAGLNASCVIMNQTLTAYFVSWGASTYATSYTLNGYGGYTGPNTSYSFQKSSSANPSAQFYVKACNATGCSAWSPTVTPGYCEQ